MILLSIGCLQKNYKIMFLRLGRRKGIFCTQFFVRWRTSEVNKSGSKPTFSVIFEDEDYLFVTKESNVGCEPSQEFHQQIVDFASSQYGYSPRMIFPIEKVCSGVTLFGKSLAAENHFYKYIFNRFKNYQNYWKIY